MADLVGIRFPNSGKTYCFKAEAMELSVGDRVVVESELGISIGSVAKTSMESDTPKDKLRPVLRKVTAADLKQQEENDGVRQEASIYCKECIHTRALPMKLITTEVTLDRKRFIFYFTADTRIDFRELVKDLASKFRTRIELRQIGVRDAAKMAGGYGICGKELCCKTWLRSFAPISIKMAKQQDLVLNTCKLSGLCGRLLCCLNYEYEEGGARRKRQKPAVAAPSVSDTTAKVEAKVSIPEMPEALIGEPLKPADQVLSTTETRTKPAQAGQADKSDEANKDDKASERRHFKKGRRSGRSRTRRKAQSGQATEGKGEGTDKTQSQQNQQQQGRPQQASDQKKGEAGADSTSNNKRRRRRRGRRRKPGGAPDGGGKGPNKPNEPSGSGGSSGPSSPSGPSGPASPG